jgi:leader peptidase (prepilin peptidase)/N-methyltransferase
MHPMQVSFSYLVPHKMERDSPFESRCFSMIVAFFLVFGGISGFLLYHTSNRLLIASAHQQLFPSQDPQHPSSEHTTAIVQQYTQSWRASLTAWQCLLMSGSGACLFGFTVWHYGIHNNEWLAGVLLISVFITIVRTDLLAMLIHDKVVFPALLLALLVRLVHHPLPWWDYVGGAVIGFGLLWLLAIVSRGGMGGGDVKLYLFIGLLCGIEITLLSLFVASLLGTAVGIVLRLRKRLSRRSFLPFGPFIAVGTYVSFLYHETWFAWYTNMFL